MKATANQTAENVNEVMDNRIVKLNELKAVKMANLSKGKRPAAKEAKGLALFILENWDNVQQLEHLLENAPEDTHTELGKEVLDIAQDRRNELATPKKAKQTKAQKELVEKATKGKKAVTMELQKGMGKSATAKKAQPKAEKVKTEEVKLTKNELEVLQAMVVNAKHYGEDDAFVLSELKLERARSTSSLSGTMSSLCSKGMVLASNGDSYFDGVITKAGLEAAGIVEEAPKAKKETKATKKAEPKKEDKKEEAKTASAPKSTKKVGDIHKNGKWMWTEYQPGKFDWRTIPTMKQKTGAKPKTETAPKSETKKAEKKQTATKSAKAEKSNAKQTKKGETKKNSPEAPKQLTIAEFIALPVKTAKGNKKPSDAQKEAFKLIMKGYTITADQKFFEKDGDRKSCNIDSVTAMFKRYGIDYIPEGLIKKVRSYEKDASQEG